MNEVLITSSALIIALLLLRKLFRNSLSRRVQYALWALVLVRLLIPVNLPAMDFSVLTAAKPVEETVTQSIVERPIYVPVAQEALEEHPTARKVAPEHTLTAVGESVWIAQTEQETAIEYRRLAPQTVLYWVWMAGSCAAGAFLLFANLRFWLWLRKARKPYEIENCKLPVYLVEAGLPSPCLFGLFSPAIYLTPAALDSAESLRHVIAHETTHARHLDHLWTLLRGVCLAMYWFDPLVWAAASAAKTDCELACDEGALAKLKEEERIPYGKTLLSLIPVRQTVNPLLATTAMSSGKKHLKDRFTRIARKTRQTAAAVVAAAVLVAGVSACTFTGGNTGKVVVCFDIANVHSTTDGYDLAIRSFLHWVDDCHKYMDFPLSSEDIEVVVIPGVDEGISERAAALQRVRAEIMAGRGPDVFICNAFSGRAGVGAELESEEDTRVFSYLEGVRERGFFLPLDDLLSELTLTDVNDWFPKVLDGGKNQKGEQVILPLIFTVPGTVFSGENAPEYDFEGTSWYDVLEGDDPILREQTVWSMNFSRFDQDFIRVGDHATGLPYIFPEIADYQAGTLAFSEEELAAMIKDSLNAYRQAMEYEMTEYCASLFFSPWSLDSSIGGGFYVPHGEEERFSFVPLRNLEGGSTAMVTAYCAVNANTEKKEKAIAVIDALMCKDFQKNGTFYSYIGGQGMPMNRKMASSELYYLGHMRLTDRQYENWMRICDDINVVRFPSQMDAELDAMMQEIEDSMFLCENPYSGVIQRDERILQGSVTDEELAEIVSKYYQQMQKLLDES